LRKRRPDFPVPIDVPLNAQNHRIRAGWTCSPVEAARESIRGPEQQQPPELTSIISLQFPTIESSTSKPAPAQLLASPTLLARNATLSLLTEGWTFLVLVVAMPRLVASLGETSFGLFSLAWVVIGYLTFLDIGVSRAATKYISEHLAERDIQAAREIIRTALITNLVLGLVGGLAVVLAAPFLMHSVFKISADLEHQAWLVFCIVGVAVPVLLMHGVLRAVLTSFQRFGWINSVNALVTPVQWGMACWLAWKGYGVSVVVLATVVTRMVAAAAYAILAFRLVRGSGCPRVWGLVGLLKLLRFGSWVTVSQLVAPVLVFLDRVLIASFLSLGAVTLYTVPFEAMTRLRIIPSSLVSTLYPALSERGTEEEETNLQRMYEGSLRYLLFALLPGIAFLLVLGPDLLTLWMGAKFAKDTTIVLQLLAVGSLANALSYVPYTALQALGRPDLTGKFHLLELPVYIGICLFLIPRWGVAGAALGNTLRCVLDAALLFWAAQRYCSCSLRRVWRQGVPMAVVGILLGATLLGMQFFLRSNWFRLGAGITAIAFYFLCSWHFIFSNHEKSVIASALCTFRQEPAS
jgi:O-antigen/teichoic acid export membrane protein